MFVVTTCCRCSPVMASAITGTIGGLSTCLFGDWCDRLHWGVTGLGPSNAVTTEVVTTNVFPIFCFGLGRGAIASCS
ncbi:hypothetical protein NG799_09055 [Laspinema sp. D1]|uniref:Secreted protein n=1 Tax=Laspinema palackyanum D2a TaxID=2953684 RepID=A0ABT2MP09_9CYAN|nr:hypothetical protein [Laspinema sp. D2a]